MDIEAEIIRLREGTPDQPTGVAVWIPPDRTDNRRKLEELSRAAAVAALDGNIASLYSATGQLESAAQWIEGAAERLSPADRSETPKLLMQLATVRARQDRFREALRLFRQAADAADQARDTELYAMAWNRAGEELLLKGLHQMVPGEFYAAATRPPWRPGLAVRLFRRPGLLVRQAVRPGRLPRPRRARSPGAIIR